MKHIVYVALIFFASNNLSISATRDNSLKEDLVHVNKWNTFVSELYELHLNLTKNIPISTEEITGGYGGGFANKNFYREISYYNKNTKQLISIIQWEVDHPDTLHTIEIFLYDPQGKVKTDFYARYLPYARNAPVQTLINIHNYNDELHSFRQFDANGELIYETCRGKYFNKEVNLHLDNEEILDFRNNNLDEWLNEVYSACFENVTESASAYLSPLKFVDSNVKNTVLPIEHDLEILNHQIAKTSSDALLYIKRGKIYFLLHQFEKAINDYNSALSIDKSLIQAYFERGMALARNGQVQEGIDDITYFIKFNPKNSLAYTKRGVRYIWLGKLDKAKKDLLRAVKIDNTNSEAHDDLGVIYAQNKQYNKALDHFSTAIQYDPSYQKAYHNLAMAYILTNKPELALSTVNKSLLLDGLSRNSLMLKSEILKALGKHEEAGIIMRKAEFLPEGNWSERFSLEQ